MKINIKYGIDSHELETINAPKISDLTSNQTLRAVLGFGDNVKALVNGVQVGGDTLVADGTTVVLETACNTKAQPVS